MSAAISSHDRGASQPNTAPDLIGRLRQAHEHSQQRINGSDIFKAAADEIERLVGGISAPAGWKLVPVTPTREMTMHGAGALPAVEGVFGTAGQLCTNVWEMMLDKAPAAARDHKSRRETKRHNRTAADWAKVQPCAVLSGSAAQARNVFEMALEDIAFLAADRDRAERNRDMWKGQCDRQADQLRARQWQPMASAPRDGTRILAIVAPDRGRHLESHVGRTFAIHHEGKTASGFDLGWAVYPGFGGASDADFILWQPIVIPACAHGEDAYI